MAGLDDIMEGPATDEAGKSYMDINRSLCETIKDYQSILNEIADGVSETDLAGNLTFTNDAICRIWGYTREEILGTSYQAYMNAEGARFLHDAYNKVYQTGQPGRYVHEIIRKDGVSRVVEDSVSLIRDDDQNILGFRTVQRDVTDREEAKQKLADLRRKLETICSSVKDAIITVDLDLRVTEANKSTESICCLKVPDIVGKVFSEGCQLCNKTCCEVLRQTLNQKMSIYDYRIECNHLSRYQQLVSVNSTPLLDHQGKFTGAVLVIRDITLLRDLERDLRERHKFQNIIGSSKRMQEIYSLLEDLANIDTTVLITGESGTGKELVARALHYSGQRAFRPFVTVNCSALTESLLESELFGHVRGAFTGAVKDKQGRFEVAAGGTLMLDEIGDISPLIQMKLLRVLQEKTFERIGESSPRKADVRVIACTSKNLKEKVRRGEFREDLYYRLMVVEVPLPPLRDRLEDIPQLVEYFVQGFNQKFKKDIEGISREVLDLFMVYAWPGNIRELEHAIEHAFILCRSQRIAPEHLPAAILDYSQVAGMKAGIVRASRKLTGEQDILDALHKTAGNKAKAARLLGINRRTVYRKINKDKVQALF